MGVLYLNVNVSRMRIGTGVGPPRPASRTTTYAAIPDDDMQPAAVGSCGHLASQALAQLIKVGPEPLIVRAVECIAHIVRRLACLVGRIAHNAIASLGSARPLLVNLRSEDEERRRRRCSQRRSRLRCVASRPSMSIEVTTVGVGAPDIPVPCRITISSIAPMVVLIEVSHAVSLALTALRVPMPTTPAASTSVSLSPG